MLYREIIAVCSQIHSKHINTLCGQNLELLNVKLAVDIMSTGLVALTIVVHFLEVPYQSIPSCSQCFSWDLRSSGTLLSPRYWQIRLYTKYQIHLWDGVVTPVPVQWPRWAMSQPRSRGSVLDWHCQCTCPRKQPDKLWCPNSLLFVELQGAFPRGKTAR
jgi:hypothetical protein